MRAPPPVEYTSALGRAWRVASSLLVGACAAVSLAWGLPYAAAVWGGDRPDALSDALAGPAVQGGLALAIGLVATAIFWLSSTRRAGATRTLRWDGQDWLLAGKRPGASDRRGDAALMLDLGPWMLVRFVPAASAGPGAPTWLPLALAGDPARWAALRGALWNWRSHEAARP
jgi:hypothetical protein